ncbi:MAG: hypothetical protein PHZ00_00830 [Candidatus Peribacteraceae bacterium]|nr:hypothetical protein [Candidatus Peribacteraceae bacterium]
MVNPFITTAGTTAAITVMIIQVLSLAVLILATFEFRSIIEARRDFLEAMGYRDSLRSVFWNRLLLLFYIVSILIITVVFDLLFLFRPDIM